MNEAPSNPSTPKTNPFGCFWVALLIAGIGWLAEQPGCAPAQNSGPEQVTKAAWKETLHNRFPNVGAVQLLTPIQLEDAMGPPSSTQTLGRNAYWYYDCSDGMIQVIMLDPAVYKALHKFADQHCT